MANFLPKFAEICQTANIHITIDAYNNC